MALNIYWIGLFILIPVVVLLVGYKVILRLFWTTKFKEENAQYVEARKFRRTFLRVYLVVMGSEWLQGPYLYSLFRDEKGLDERTVATLYVATYISAAVSALWTGYMADKFGRRTSCLIFCGIHSLASISVKFNDIRILVAGRILSGIGLNLLWTVFESWMITEYNSRKLDQRSFPLSSMFSIMTKYNCITAIIAGVVGHCIVLASGSKTDPFIVGVVLDVCGVLLMLWTWNENKGNNNGDSSLCDEEGLRSDTADDKPPQRATGGLKDMRIWVLSFASCCFEGAIFIFTFSWPGTLQAAHDREHTGDGDAIPYGVIFATFMATMVLGTMIFGFLTRNAKLETVEQVPVLSAVLPTLVLGTAFFVGALSFLIAAFSKTELHSYVAFLLLEFCNGVYIPSMAYHRGMIVNDSNRAMIYGLMNIPLFIFVVIALYATSNNGVEHRQTLFASSAVLPLIAALAVVLGFGMRVVRPGFSQIKTDEVELMEKDKIEADNTK
ncbi:MFS general substrate transporter [Annulohypoxylon bovei var. microspora]|nr:MFS general substrate transporter [Annulohypoxylon bovei var. microspora]